MGLPSEQRHVPDRKEFEDLDWIFEMEGEPRACRVCGCTDEDCRGCIERTGLPCSWVEDDLCSACVPVTGPAASPRK
jgi:hypothetical protein